MKASTSLLLFLTISACAQQSAPPLRQGLAAQSPEEATYTTVEFERGRSGLTDASRRNLNILARKVAGTGREVAEIKILAWADREYTGKKAGSPRTRDVILANERASAIRNFLRDDLHSKDPIDVFNMAKSPGLLDRLTRDEEYQVKRDVARAGVSGTRLPSGETSYTKAGKGFVIIDYAEETK